MSRRILLADDSVTIQKVIELTFLDEDYEVKAVSNGDEAIAALPEVNPDFVIADVHMPGANGYEVCRRSKEQRPDIPVLLLEGSARLPGLSGSASLRDRSLTVTLTNPSLRDGVVARLRLAGGAHLREARATVLTHEDMRAANTFEKPQEVALASLPAQVSADTATVTIPKQAVVAVSIQIA